MRRARPNLWSLRSSGDLLALALGSAVGIGSFSVLPALVFYKGGLAVIVLHVLSLLLLGLPVIIAELIWGRWLLRPFSQSFRAVSPNLGWVPLLSTAAILFVAPPYYMELGRIGCVLGESLLGGITTWEGVHLRIEAAQMRSFFATVALLTLCALACMGPTARIARIVRGLLAFAFPSWIFLTAWVVASWGIEGLQRLFYWPSQLPPWPIFLQVTTFSLFSLSAGMGVLFNYVYYASQAPVGGKPGADTGVGRSGLLLKTALLVLAGDLFSSFAALAILSPYGWGNLGPEAQGVLPAELVFERIPQVLSSGRGSIGLASLHFAALLAAGSASAISLFDWAVFNLEREMRWSRRRTVAHIWVLGLCLASFPLVPYLSSEMEALGMTYFLPLSALFISIAVGWRMPRKAQQLIFGRGLVLDRVFLLWRFSIRFLTPGFLAYLLIRSVL
jgi:NSS family neurotransmitter:Na+ symporter